MVDVFVIVEGYCHLFVERLDLVEKEKLVFFFFFYTCTCVLSDAFDFEDDMISCLQRMSRRVGGGGIELDICFYKMRRVSRASRDARNVHITFWEGICGSWC